MSIAGRNLERNCCPIRGFISWPLLPASPLAAPLCPCRVVLLLKNKIISWSFGSIRQKTESWRYWFSFWKIKSLTFGSGKSIIQKQGSGNVNNKKNQCCRSGSRIRDPVPFWSRIRNRFFPDPGSRVWIRESGFVPYLPRCHGSTTVTGTYWRVP